MYLSPSVAPFINTWVNVCAEFIHTGWITEQGLSIIFQQVAVQDNPIKQAPGRMHMVGITFEQHQQCVALLSRRLRLSVGHDYKDSGPNYRQSLDSHDVATSSSTGGTSEEKRRLAVEPAVVRAFAKIHRAVRDESTFLRFCTELPARGETSSYSASSLPCSVSLPTSEQTREKDAASEREVRFESQQERIQGMFLAQLVDLLRSLGLIST